jgi:hypothetical protein
MFISKALIASCLAASALAVDFVFVTDDGAQHPEELPDDCSEYSVYFYGKKIAGIQLATYGWPGKCIFLTGNEVAAVVQWNTEVVPIPPDRQSEDGLIVWCKARTVG